MDVPVRFTGILALLALIPAGLYLTGTGQADPISTALTAVNVVFISVAIFLLFGPAPADHANGSGTTP